MFRFGVVSLFTNSENHDARLLMWARKMMILLTISILVQLGQFDTNINVEHQIWLLTQIGCTLIKKMIKVNKMNNNIDVVWIYHWTLNANWNILISNWKIYIIVFCWLWFGLHALIVFIVDSEVYILAQEFVWLLCNKS